MKSILTMCCFLAYNFSFGQNYAVEYGSTINGAEWSSILYINDSGSIWTFKDKTCEQGTEMVKEVSSNSCFYTEKLFSTVFNVKDTLHPFKWVLSSDTVTILGYLCQSATTLFRGREYMAYFTNSMVANNGPWKFGGLPGLILSVRSSDGFLAYQAKRIAVEQKNHEVSCLQMDTKFISWGDYKKKFINAFDAAAKLIVSNGLLKPGSTAKYKVDAPEILYPAVQTGEGLIVEP